jgi:hypothetical protein
VDDLDGCASLVHEASRKVVSVGGSLTGSTRRLDGAVARAIAVQPVARALPRDSVGAGRDTLGPHCIGRSRFGTGPENRSWRMDGSPATRAIALPFAVRGVVLLAQFLAVVVALGLLRRDPAAGPRGA